MPIVRDSSTLVFNPDNTYLTETDFQSAVENLGRNYVTVDHVLGDKLLHGATFNDCDKFDDLLGKVYDGVATPTEIAIISEINIKLGLKVQ